MADPVCTCCILTRYEALAHRDIYLTEERKHSMLTFSYLMSDDLVSKRLSMDYGTR